MAITDKNCGCKEDLSVLNIRYDGNDLACISIQPGDNLSTIFKNINDIICTLKENIQGLSLIENVGTGAGLYKGVSETSVQQFKSLIAGAGISIDETTNEVQISSVYQTTALDFNPLTNQLTATYVDGSQKSVVLSFTETLTSLSWDNPTKTLTYVDENATATNIDLTSVFSETLTSIALQAGDIAYTDENSAQTIIPLPKNTSDLINDGDDGINQFLSVGDNISLLTNNVPYLTSADLPSFDAVPTDGSTNGVESNGVYDALQTYLSRTTGGTMFGDINMNGRDITNGGISYFGWATSNNSQTNTLRLTTTGTDDYRWYILRQAPNSVSNLNIQTESDGSPGVFITRYTLNYEGSPTIATDLVTKAYGDANYLTSSSISVSDEGTPVATLSTLNFIGAGVNAVDAGGGQIDVTITGGVIFPVDDTESLVQDPLDNSKQIRLDAGNITTANTRAIIMADQDVDLSTLVWDASGFSNNLATTDDTLQEIFDKVDALIGGAGHTIQDEGTPLTQRTNLDFVGDGVTVTDDSVNNKTIVTVPGNILAVTTTSGWANYADTTYTTGSPFLLTTAAGKVNLPNNAGTVVDSEKPSDITTFYNGTAITGQEGDAYSITIEFKVRPTTAASDVRISTTIDIGGAVGELYPRDFSLTKGSGVEHYYISSFLYYTLDTWQANGGIVKVQATNSNVEIYDIRYVIAREHKAGNSYVQSNAITADDYAALINANSPSISNTFVTQNDIAGITWDPSGFSGNLAPTDDTLQEVFNKLDTLTTDLTNYARTDIAETFDNRVIVGANGSVADAFRLIGTGTGNLNTSYISFYESNGVTRQGYLGFPGSSDSNLRVFNDITNQYVQLLGTGGNNALQFYNGTIANTVWHSGNDGIGSGLDADFLNGTPLADIAQTNISEVFESNLRIAGNSYIGNSDLRTIIRDNNSGITILSQNNAGGGSIYLRPNGDASITGQFVLDSSGNVTVNGDVSVTDEAYGSGWNGSLEVPTKNAVYDKIESLKTTGTGTTGIVLRGATAGTYTVGSQSWLWKRVSDLVVFRIVLLGISGTSPTGNLRVDLSSITMPDIDAFGIFNVQPVTWNSSYDNLQAISNGGNFIEFIYQATAATTTSSVTNEDFTNGAIYITGSYLTNEA